MNVLDNTQKLCVSICVCDVWVEVASTLKPHHNLSATPNGSVISWL